MHYAVTTHCSHLQQAYLPLISIWSTKGHFLALRLVTKEYAHAFLFYPGEVPDHQAEQLVV